MKIKNIVWDTDGEFIPSLPSEFEIPEDVLEEIYEETEDEGEILDFISDWLSDEYGFCHYGFEVE